MQPVASAPPDFDDFWATTLDELRRVPLDVRRTPHPVQVAGTTAHALSFLSLGNRRIRGYQMLWNDGALRPLVVHAHGYRSRAEPRSDWVRAGCHVLGFDFRGFGRSTDAVPTPSAAGWLLTGARQPETSVLRGAVCDYIRATQVAADLTGVAIERFVSHGVSLAGGLATMAEAVAPHADLLVLGVPTFGWVEGRRLLVERGSGAEVATFLARHPQYPEDDLQAVLAYFDATLFAPLITCPTLIGIGIVDRVVPSAAVRPIADLLQARREVMTFPVSHDSGPAMREWERFDERWLTLARNGVPTGFGRQPNAAATSTHLR
ncbi:alpha/beta fold hydrolase [soil metagenome]